MILCERQIKILRALRLKRIAAADMFETFPNGQAIRMRLMEAGLISFDGDYFQITLKGREVCPNEDLSAAIKPERIPMSQAGELFRKTPKWQQKQVELNKVELQRVEHKEIDVTENKASEIKPRALQVLEFIENNPNCTSKQLNDAVDFDSPNSYIRHHIKNKKVIQQQTLGKKFTYVLADGLTATDVYGQGVKNCGKKDKQVDSAPVTVETIGKVLDIPQLIEQSENVEDTPVVFEYEDEPQTNVGKGFRVSYTSHDCLIVSGDDMDFELNAQQTKQLIHFVEKVRMIR